MKHYYCDENQYPDWDSYELVYLNEIGAEFDEFGRPVPAVPYFTDEWHDKIDNFYYVFWADFGNNYYTCDLHDNAQLDEDLSLIHNGEIDQIGGRLILDDICWSVDLRPFFNVYRINDGSIQDQNLQKMIVHGLSTRLKDAHKASGLDIFELAALSNVSANDIALLEEGFNNRRTYIPALADALNVNPLWLETGKGDRIKKSE